MDLDYLSEFLQSPKGKMTIKVISRGVFLGIFLVGLLCVFHPDIRSYLRGIFHKQYREVLSSATGPYLDVFPASRVIKVRTNDGLFVEVYGRNQNGARPLIDRIQLPDRRDGYFSFAGRTSNLFIHDVDGDDVPEILAPSFDDNLMAHLNVYRLNVETLKLEPKTTPVPR
ncbi:MAG: hypothetical protein H6624_14395 [Bdellovibrionaceae bacterium]|nr:hypothetical protein [Bdellovibrionales bacterium]MCB9085533.1 hypothetical protein [Pseudobdellovibrionaceae bacterium]